MHNQARNRRTSAHSTPPTRRGPIGQVRSASSASATPTGMEEDEDGQPKRSTRGRNPLPPSSGPLFPPLPPKVPKLPKAHSSSSLSVHETADADAEAEAEGEGEKPDVEMEPAAATTSNAGSLTPPPPGSEGVTADADDGEDAEVDAEGDVTVQEVKVEDQAEADADSHVEGSKEEAVESQSARSKRRRGEEALLLDDHLLPAEMRRTGKLDGKRAHRPSFNAAESASTKPDIPRPPSATVKQDAEEDVEMKEPESEITAELTTDPDQDQEDGEEEQEEEEEEEDGQDITRCVCHQDDIDVMMIQCDKCNVWQHGPCMGIWADDEAPDEYYCEECRPDLHGPLKRWIRNCGRNPSLFVAPRPEDLKKLRPYNDKSPPSQSKRWTDPALMSPPASSSSLSAAPAKSSSSRSHHKKDLDVPAHTHDYSSSSSSSRPARRLPFPDKPSSSTSNTNNNKDKDKDKQGKRRQGHDGSASPNRSLSPSTALHSAARRRITMNSRDAMYEEQYKAAVEASRREALGLPPLEVEVPEDAVEEEETDKKEVKKGKRKRDEDSVEPSGGKVKHPNQYTYRPKPTSSAQSGAAAAAVAAAAVAASSPARRGAGTPVPSSAQAPIQHEHGTRRAGAIASGAIINPTLSAQSVANLNWFLPEHLASHSDLLPTPQPVALDVRSQRTLPTISRNHWHNQRYGPFSETRDAQGKLVLPDTQPLRTPTGEPDTHSEPPARVKYPAKRITVAEMRKRVRSMLDYVAKIQSTEDKRIERNAALGIVVKPLPPKLKTKKTAKGNVNGEDGEDVDMEADADAEAGDTNETPAIGDGNNDDEQNTTDNTTRAPPRTSTELMEELTRDLLAFQDTYMSGANGIISPMPPAVPSFEPAMPLPGPEPDTMLDGDAEGQEDAAAAAAAAAVVEEAEASAAPSLDVYREGEVDKVIDEPTDDPAEEPQLDSAPPPPPTQSEPALEVQAPILEPSADTAPPVAAAAEGKIGLGLEVVADPPLAPEVQPQQQQQADAADVEPVS